MFSNTKVGDTVLIMVNGKKDSPFETTEEFFVPATVVSHTSTRLTAGGITYKKKDGCSYPHGNGYCLKYDASRDETSKLRAHNAVSSALSAINSHLYDFGRLRVNRKTKNINTILKQAEILSALIKEGSK